MNKLNGFLKGLMGELKALRSEVASLKAKSSNKEVEEFDDDDEVETFSPRRAKRTKRTTKSASKPKAVKEFNGGDIVISTIPGKIRPMLTINGVSHLIGKADGKLICKADSRFTKVARQPKVAKVIESLYEEGLDD